MALPLRYDNIGTINAVELLPKIDSFNEYILLYSVLDSHIEEGDYVFITNNSGKDFTIKLDNTERAFNIDENNFIYCDEMQGYEVIFVDKNKNAFAIDKKIDISIPIPEIDNHFVSKVYCVDINFNNGSIDSTLLKKTIINGDNINSNNINWIQAIMLSGDIYNTYIKNKYALNYITQHASLNSDDSILYSLSLNNETFGYSYFYNLNESIQNCSVLEGNYYNCNFANITGYIMNGGYYENCYLNNCIINDGYYFNTRLEETNCIWNYGKFEININVPGYHNEFTLAEWNDGIFINGVFGSPNKKVTWHNGTFINGAWDGFIWENGTFNNGKFGFVKTVQGTYNYTLKPDLVTFDNIMGINKKDLDGKQIINLNEYVLPKWLNGEFNGGFMLRCNWADGIVRGGILAETYFNNVIIYDGGFINSTIKKSEIYDGVFSAISQNLIINNSNINGGTITMSPNNDLKKYIYDNDLINNFNYYFNSFYTSNLNNQLHILSDNIINDINITDCGYNNGNKLNDVFIAKQQEINGGYYKYVNFDIPQTISVDTFEDSDKSGKTNTEYNINLQKTTTQNGNMGYIKSISVLPISGSINDIPTKLVYIDLPEGNPFTNDIKAVQLKGFSKMYNLYYSIKKTIPTIDFPVTPDIIAKDIYYDLSKPIPSTTSYTHLEPFGNDYIILELAFEDYMLGDIGYVYSTDKGYISNDAIFTINKGIFNNIYFQGKNNITSTIIINNGTFNNSELVDSIKFNNGTFNGKNIYSHNSTCAIKWYNGNFISGIFGVDNTNYIVEETMRLWQSNTDYYTGNTLTPDIDPITYASVYKLTDIHPLVVSTSPPIETFPKLRAWFENPQSSNSLNSFFDIPFNEDGKTNFNSHQENDLAWVKGVQPDITLSLGKKILPYEFVFVINCLAGNGKTAQQNFDSLITFLSIAQDDVEVLDIGFLKTFNELYTKPINSLDGANKTYHRSYLKGFYKSTFNNNFNIGLLFSFDEITKLYNHPGNTYLSAYDDFYKNVWSDANAGYYVRPMPTFNITRVSNNSNEIPVYSLIIDDDYLEYPVPQDIASGWTIGMMPPPWFYDNNGYLWYPIQKEVTQITDASNNFSANAATTALYRYYMIDGYNQQYLDWRRKPDRDIIYNNVKHDSLLYESFQNPGFSTNYLSDALNFSQVNNSISQFSNTISQHITYSNYLNGWNPYIKKDISFDFTSIGSSIGSYLYIDNNNNVFNGWTVNSTTNVYAHVICGEYEGPTLVTLIDNRLQIDVPLNSYNKEGYALSIDNKVNFTITDDNVLIFDTASLTNLAFHMLKYIYVYSSSYKGRAQIIGISAIGSQTKVTVQPDNSQTISSTSIGDKFAYYPDMWDFYEFENNLGFNTITIDKDLLRKPSTDNGIPSEVNWITNNKILLLPNSLSVPSFQSIIRMNEIWVGETFYNESEDAKDNRTYLFNKNESEESYINYFTNTGETSYLSGVSIDFTNFTGNDYNPLKGRVIRANNMFRFIKATKRYIINTNEDTSQFVVNKKEIKDRNYIFIDYKDNSIDLSTCGQISYVSPNSSNKFVEFETIIDLKFTSSSSQEGSASIIMNPKPNLSTLTGTLLEFYSWSQTTLPNYPNVIAVTCDTTYIGILPLLNLYLFRDDMYYFSDVTLIKVVGNTIYLDGSNISYSSINNRGYIAVKPLEGYFAYCYEDAITDKNKYKFIIDGIDIGGNDGDPSQPMVYKADKTRCEKNDLKDINLYSLRTNSTLFERKAGIKIKSFGLNDDISVFFQDWWYGGNFYSGKFYGTWEDGRWFAKNTTADIKRDEKEFNGLCLINNNIIGKSLLDSPPQSINENLITQATINNLIYKKQYYLIAPWDSSTNIYNTIVKPKITKKDEQS